MRKISSFLFAMLLTFAMSGCALLGGPIAEKVADVIDDYCTEPFAARQLYRDTVNQELASEGHSIEVHCAGDPDDVGAIGGPVSDDIVAAVDAYCAAPGNLLSTTNHRVAVRCRNPGEGG